MLFSVHNTNLPRFFWRGECVIKEKKMKNKHEQLINLSEDDLKNICLSYRHDFGLLSHKEQENLKFEAKEWARAIYNNNIIGGI